MDQLLVALVAFSLAGFVKGVLGFGFPIIVIVILTLTTGLLEALALVVLPALATNIWQAYTGPYLRQIVCRMGVYFTLSVAGILVAGLFITNVDARWLTGMLGAVLVIFALSRLLRVHLTVPERYERPISVVLGFGNGVLTGFTGVFMVPSVLYMQALGFQKDMLVQAMGLFFALSTLSLMISLGSNNLLDWQDVGVSTAALVPSFVGIYLGRLTRDRIDEALFQKLFLGSVLLLGAYIVWRSLAAAN